MSNKSPSGCGTSPTIRLSQVDQPLQGQNQRTTGKRNPKTNFVEARTFCHLYRSFDRLWIFYILAFQAMLIVAWSVSLSNLFNEDVSKNVLSIFITSAFLTFLQATLDIILSWYAWRSLGFSQILRYLLKFVVAAFWLVVLPIAYSKSVQNPTGLVKFFSQRTGDWRAQSFYNYCVAIYLIPNILAALLFLLPFLRRFLERSNWHIVVLMMWWAQPKLYVGRGMHEGMFALLKFCIFFSSVDCGYYGISTWLVFDCVDRIWLRGDESATISGPFLQEDVLSLKGLEFIPEQAEPAEAAPELAMASPSPLLSQSKSQLTKKL